MRSLCLLAISASLLSGCIRYYKTNDIRSRLVQGRRQLNKMISKVEVDHRSKQAACRARPVAGSQPLLTRMAAALRELRAHRKGLVAIERDFGKLARGRRKIRSDSPQWEPLKTIRQRTNQLRDRINETGNAYKKATNQLGKLLRG